MTGSFTYTRGLLAVAVMNRSSGAPVPSALGGPARDVGAGPSVIRIVSGSVRRSRPPARTVTGSISNVPSAVAWNRCWNVSDSDVRPSTICIDVEVPEPRYTANADRSGSTGGSSSSCCVPETSTFSTNCRLSSTSVWLR